MEDKKNYRNNRIWSGLVILLIGVVFFLDNIGLNIPNWVVSWHTLLILIGLLVGYKRNFNGGGWLIMVLIGGYFTMEEITAVNLSKYYFAFAFIILGLYLIFKPKRTGKFNMERCKKRYARFDQFESLPNEGDADLTGENPIAKDFDENDILDSVNVFGGSHQNIYSKNFRGGDVIAIFGGSDVNLTQADFQGTVILDVVAVFGGVKIIVPSSWEVKSEIAAIFGGLEDKRASLTVPDAQRKVLKIKGVALFGGVEIRNF